MGWNKYAEIIKSPFNQKELFLPITSTAGEHNNPNRIREL
jgi:hypothetical protein